MKSIVRYERMWLLAALLLLPVSVAGAAGGDRPALLLPATNELPGWERDGEALEYEAENLWEYINGSAETFLAYAFRDVVAQDYRKGAGLELKVEIYRHDSPLMAFGISSQYTAHARALLPSAATKQSSSSTVEPNACGVKRV